MATSDKMALLDNAYVKIELQQLKHQVSGLIASPIERKQTVVLLHYFPRTNFERETCERTRAQGVCASFGSISRPGPRTAGGRDSPRR